MIILSPATGFGSGRSNRPLGVAYGVVRISGNVHLVMDNYGTHKTPSVKGWLARHPRFHVHFTPTSGSWLNRVERWFATLTERHIRRGTHRSTVELEQAIRSYLDIYNVRPTPFVWTKTADQILESVKRFCMKTSIRHTSVQTTGFLFLSVSD